MSYPTALITHPDCGRHDTGWGHPEHQGRLPAIVKAIHAETPDLLEVMLQRQGEPAGVSDLLRVHPEAYIGRIRRAVERAQERERHVYLDSDTPVSGASWDAALAAAGAVISAARAVLDEEAESAFALSRPPGHHATPDRAMGFCLFNNVAVATRWAQEQAGARRVLILDWDVHHGNGTQDIFYADPSVYFVSFHLDSHYPGTGTADERGEGAGLGTTRNVPLAAGTGFEEYRARFVEALDTVLGEFDPDLVIVSAGFDCLSGDPLGGLRLEPSDLHELARIVQERARSAGCGVVVALEGGYVPERVGAGVVNVLRAFAGLPVKD